VLNQVDEVLRGKPIVDRNKHRAQLGDSVKRFELRAGIRGNGGDTVALSNAQRLKCSRPAVTAVEECLVGKTLATIDNSLTVAI